MIDYLLDLLTIMRNGQTLNIFWAVKALNAERELTRQSELELDMRLRAGYEEHFGLVAEMCRWEAEMLRRREKRNSSVSRRETWT